MGIKKQNKTVFTCTDGKEFTDEQQARDHEFDTTCPPGEIGMDVVTLRKWLLDNKNFVLDYIGTQYNPEPDKSVPAPELEFVKGE